jgi:Leucine-rich repeat (LRR) protein
LTNLTYLDLTNNQVSNLTPLAGLTNLGILYLDDNQVSDLSPLAQIPSGAFLSARDEHTALSATSGVPLAASAKNVDSSAIVPNVIGCKNPATVVTGLGTPELTITLHGSATEDTCAAEWLTPNFTGEMTITVTGEPAKPKGYVGDYNALIPAQGPPPTFHAGDIVSYNGQYWIALKTINGKGQTPGKNSNFWAPYQP